MQLLECIVELEVKQRFALGKLIRARASGGGQADDSHDLVAATEKLRNVLVENYVAALAIHMQSEALTFRPFPYPGNPPMLVPRPEGGSGEGSGAVDQSGDGEQEIEIVLPAASDEPEIVVESSGVAEPPSPSLSGLPAEAAVDAPTPDHPTSIPGQARDVPEEPVLVPEGKTVEMTMKPDGTKTIKTTTTIRNPNGTTTTTITTSTVKENSAGAVPFDYFHDEETGIVHM